MFFVKRHLRIVAGKLFLVIGSRMRLPAEVRHLLLCYAEYALWPESLLRRVLLCSYCFTPRNMSP